MSKKFTKLTAPVGGKINFAKSLHPDTDKAKAIDDAFSKGDKSPRGQIYRDLVSRDFSVVIPTHNGIENLKTTIPALLSALKKYKKGNAEVLLMDNASSNSTGAVAKRTWPSLRVIRTDNIKGMPEILNRGVKTTRYPVVLILQDTVKVDPGFALPLLEAISDDDIFAAVPSIRDKARKGMITSISLLKFYGGTMSLHMISDGNFPEPVYIPGIISTACMFRKETFNSLGGFDELFSPFYLEDLDLGYRAWKRGHRVVYCRNSSVHQIGRNSLEGSLRPENLELLKIKNYLTFMAKNITERGYYTRHWLSVLRKLFLIYLGMDKDKTYLSGWKKMRKSARDISQKRKTEKTETYFTDSELVRLFSSHPDNRIGIG